MDQRIYARTPQGIHRDASRIMLIGVGVLLEDAQETVRYLLAHTLD